MPRKRNSLGQFTSKDTYNSLFIEIPGPIKIFKYFLVLFAISPWIFVILFRVDMKSNFKKLIEYIFGINQEETKKANRFFLSFYIKRKSK